jgi:hypothetical protein
MLNLPMPSVCRMSPRAYACASVGTPCGQRPSQPDLALLANIVVEDLFAGVELLGRARVRQPNLERQAVKCAGDHRASLGRPGPIERGLILNQLGNAESSGTVGVFAGGLLRRPLGKLGQVIGGRLVGTDEVVGSSFGRSDCAKQAWERGMRCRKRSETFRWNPAGGKPVQ